MIIKRPILIIAGLIAIYLILKWTCKLLYGLLDYTILIVSILGIVYFFRLPDKRKKELPTRIKTTLKLIWQKLENIN